MREKLRMAIEAQLMVDEDCGLTRIQQTDRLVSAVEPIVESIMIDLEHTQLKLGQAEEMKAELSRANSKLDAYIKREDEYDKRIAEFEELCIEKGAQIAAIHYELTKALDRVHVLETELNAWKEALGTGQLTHAIAILDRANALDQQAREAQEPTEGEVSDG